MKKECYFNLFEIEKKCVTAWAELPEPYQPK